MPLIYLQTQDGVRIAVPEEAARLSGVLRRVLDSWEEMYGPPPPIATTDDDIYVCSGTESEGTPDRIGDDDYGDQLCGMGINSINDPSCHYSPSRRSARGRMMNGTEKEGGGTAQPSPAKASDDSDGTASVLDDDEPANDSPSPSPSLSSPSAGSWHKRKGVLRGNGPRYRNDDGGDEDDQEVAGYYRRGNPSINVSDGGFATLGKGMGSVDGERFFDGDDSATPSTLDDDDQEEGEGEGEEVGDVRRGKEREGEVEVKAMEEEKDEGLIKATEGRGLKEETVKNKGGCNEDKRQGSNSDMESKEMAGKEGDCSGEGEALRAQTLGGYCKVSTCHHWETSTICINPLTEDEAAGSAGTRQSGSSTASTGIISSPPGHDSKEDHTKTGSTGVSVSDMAGSGEAAAALVRPSATVVVDSLGNSGADEGVGLEECLKLGALPQATPPTPGSQTNEGVVTPGSYHQRTPCMIGDDDEVRILSASCTSLSNEGTPQAITPQQQYSNRSREALSPADNLVRCNGEQTQSPQRAVGPVRAESAPQSRRQPFSGNASESGTTCVASEMKHACLIQQCTHITNKEIVIKLQNSFSDSTCTNLVEEADTIPPRRSASSGMLGRSSATLPRSSVKSSLSKSVGSGATFANNGRVSAGSGWYLGDESLSDAQAFSKRRRISNKGTSTSGERVTPVSLSPSSDAVQLCATYLRHFAGSHRQEPLQPSPTPEPLPAPLVALLTPWEREFIYCDVLGQTAEQLVRTVAIMEHSPNISYIHPAPFLRTPGVCAALLLEPPAVERISLLLRVMRAAEALQVLSLQNLCSAWCADFIIRASYGARDHFEAAALVRKCFNVRDDWTRKEMDCLKLENEWPVDEEE
uniref:Uncharacterized protein TCIL3000_11_13700 n=1 Tax=Trypanosoma congolense (strain IL3000) TaxID=1068625 RepID=G0V2J2_TRYCI|nr:unnamed protein product [Trypanosoma congolense IL3000]